MKLAASVEKGSEHPLGKAIVKEAKARQIELSEPEDFKAAGGFGVQAEVDGNPCAGGQTQMVSGNRHRHSRPPTDKIEALQSQGKTVMVVVRDNELCGLIAVSDTLKPDSKEAIRAASRPASESGDAHR